ncbi:hypothetical protein EXT46_07555 [Pseudoalteromonas sp. CO325X]|uniref:hypothetical protein n=1 Tax=Pseudoalteromonas sp. CO325X TaxID=1777262 RepID=UPI001023101D|nr:hypothetical protein [Pseudoalteromonas sp. CO325X]RZF83288.1 hypothetical protein EXT46_07555 [Pseudoalteromonas sp. CO325X]
MTKFSYILPVVCMLSLSACKGAQRYHETQSQRLDECAYKNDDDYFACLEQQKQNYQRFQQQRQQENN